MPWPTSEEAAAFTYGGFFAQYFEQRPEASQYNVEAELHFDESSQFFDRCYRTIYAGAMMDVKDVESKTTNKADLFACKVLTTLAGAVQMVDACSDAPYTGAVLAKAESSLNLSNTRN